MTDRSLDPYRLTALLAGIIFFGVGLVMVFLGISAEGAIDLQGAVFSGKIKTGSAGLFVLFFSFLIIITTLFSPGLTRARSGSAVRDGSSQFKRAMSVFVLLVACSLTLAVGAAFMPEGKATGLGLAAAGFGFMAFIALFAVLTFIEDEGKKQASDESSQRDSHDGLG
jgi:hypothetical protein